MAYVEAKKIKGRVYLYLRWRDNSGRLRSRYLGRAPIGWHAGMTLKVDSVEDVIKAGAKAIKPPARR